MAPSLRKDLVASPVDENGVTYVDVSDPRSGRSFRLYDFEYALATQLDGRSLDVVVAWAKESYGLELTVDALAQFAEQLAGLGFLEGSEGGAQPSDLAPTSGSDSQGGFRWDEFAATTIGSDPSPLPNTAGEVPTTSPPAPGPDTALGAAPVEPAAADLALGAPDLLRSAGEPSAGEPAWPAVTAPVARDLVEAGSTLPDDEPAAAPSRIISGEATEYRLKHRVRSEPSGLWERERDAAATAMPPSEGGAGEAPERTQVVSAASILRNWDFGHGEAQQDAERDARASKALENMAPLAAEAEAKLELGTGESTPHAPDDPSRVEPNGAVSPAATEPAAAPGSDDVASSAEVATKDGETAMGASLSTPPVPSSTPSSAPPSAPPSALPAPAMATEDAVPAPREPVESQLLDVSAPPAPAAEPGLATGLASDSAAAAEASPEAEPPPPAPRRSARMTLIGTVAPDPRFSTTTSSPPRADDSGPESEPPVDADAKSPGERDPGAGDSNPTAASRSGEEDATETAGASAPAQARTEAPAEAQSETRAQGPSEERSEAQSDAPPAAPTETRPDSRAKARSLTPVPSPARATSVQAGAVPVRGPSKPTRRLARPIADERLPPTSPPPAAGPSLSELSFAAIAATAAGLNESPGEPPVKEAADPFFDAAPTEVLPPPGGTPAPVAAASTAGGPDEAREPSHPRVLPTLGALSASAAAAAPTASLSASASGPSSTSELAQTQGSARRQPATAEVVVMPPLDDPGSGATGAAGRGSRLPVLITLLVLTAAGAVAFWAFRPDLPPAPPPSVPRVKVVAASPTTFYSWFDVTGTVVPGRDAVLAFRSTGKIDNVLAPGTTFAAGEMVARLKGAEIEEQAVNELRSRVAYYQQMLESYRAQGRSTEAEQTQVWTDKKKKALAEAEAKLALVELRPGAAGEIAEVLAKPGTVREAGAPVLRIRATGPRALFPLSPEQRAKALALPFCRVETIAGTGGADAGDREGASRAFDCSFGAPAAGEEGLTVDIAGARQLEAGTGVRLASGRYDGVFPVPASAVGGEGPERFVWVVRANNAATRVTVEVAGAVEDLALVSRGVRVGESVIVAPPQDLENGAPVYVER